MPEPIQTVKEGKEKTTYELAFLLKAEADFARVAEIVRQHGGEFIGEPRLKNVALSYKIKGHTEAVFGSVLATMMGGDAKALEEDLITRDVPIRFLILKAQPMAEQPAVVPSFGDDSRRRMSPSGSNYMASGREPREPKPAVREPLSNEALEKLLEKI